MKEKYYGWLVYMHRKNKGYDTDLSYVFGLYPNENLKRVH